ncbi:DUF421 domain-containing protein [Alicyclobacillus contaminans]|uniref:DUF421 domain-containing protein n=1 Tax=Alicyclobacillus contaminans TaxID=392016 RepID=UPI000402A7D0|nr:DUF421 domain-containing protein [Alicyclobacillus contaminans]
MQPFGLLLIRTIVAFVLTVAAGRFLGQPLKVLAGIGLAVMAAWTVVNPGGSVYYGLTAIVAWTLLYVAVQYLTLKSLGFRNLVSGKSTPLVAGGKVLDENLRKSRMTVDDVVSMLRAKDAFKLADVEFAAMEPDGSLSVLLKSDVQPLTPKSTNLSMANEPAPATVIVDGEVLSDALANLGYTRAWLWEQIQAKGAHSWNDVFLAQVDGRGNVYVDLYNDLQPQPPDQPDPRRVVLANLKKFQADLESFSLQTANPSAKAAYAEHAQRLAQVIQRLQPYLR